MMRKAMFLRTIAALTAMSLQIACAPSDDAAGEDASNALGTGYINWADSVNGAWVADATNDTLRFRSNTGYLEFGNTTYVNTWVDANNDLVWDGAVIGRVVYIRSTSNNTITGLVSNEGTMIDVFGSEDNLAWQTTGVNPIFAIAGAGEGQTQSGADDSVTEIEEMETSSLAAEAPNALTDLSGEPREDVLWHVGQLL